jgi:hypothetical protein
MNTLQKMPEFGPDEQFARRLTAQLTQASDDLPHEISERLKAARMVALSKRKIAIAETASAVTQLGATAALHLGGEKLNIFGRLAAFIPLIALAAGLMAIQLLQDDFWVDEIASIDAELLNDELPPEAYTDPGFAQYLGSVGRD